ncbi:MAG: hypothetical protein GXY03_00125 [Solirubrobacterales bacterium]|nr:hypothetical protein [Solirubrobacterales bacterium]
MNGQARRGAATLALAALAAATAAGAAAADGGGQRGMAAEDGPRAVPEPAIAAQRGVPRIRQQVVFSDGKVLAGPVRARRASLRVDGRRCAVAAATALGALIRSRPGPLAFHDYGSCSRRPADASGLFVKRIRSERNRGLDGWVYKVGHELATAGAADPSGPFGAGRLRAGDEVVWFYCRQRARGTCQRTLEVETAVDGRRVTATVTGYDDAGEGIAVAGATVRSGRRSATTDRDGRATLRLPRGRHVLFAAKRGAIRSFARRVVVR